MELCARFAQVERLGGAGRLLTAQRVKATEVWRRGAPGPSGRGHLRRREGSNANVDFVGTDVDGLRHETENEP